MDEIYEKLSSSVNLWQGLQYLDEVSSFEAIEVWRNGSGEVSISLREVHSKELYDWLDETTRDDGDNKQSLVMRLALIGCDPKGKQLKLSQKVLDPLLDEFDLRLAYRYSRSCITNVSAIPYNGCQTYSFCYMPKLAAIWSHKRFDATDPTDQSYLTRGLIFIEESKKDAFSNMFCSPWNAILYQSPMFPAFFLSIILSMEIHQEEANIKTKIRDVEAKTGHDRVSLNKHEEGTTLSYIRLAIQVDRHAVKLAGVSRKSKMAERTLSFILKNISEQDSAAAAAAAPAGAASAETRQLLGSHVSLLQDRLAMQAVDIEFTLKRVQLQINTIAGLISRDDVKANLDLAESQHRDSLSMKTLAIVTMLFLPGSFISALFSTSMFDWDSVDPSSGSIAVRTMPQFGLYWAITIPLTVVTFLFYFFWLRVMKQRRMVKQQGDRKKEGGYDQLSAAENGETDVRRMKSRRDTEFTKKSTLSFGSF